MKIRDFNSKIRDAKGGLFQALRELRKIDVQTLLEEGETLSWEPWARLAMPEPTSA